jgi:hypothetical protein
MTNKPQCAKPESKPVNVQESLGAVKLPTNTNQNQLVDRYVKSPKK